MLLRSSARGRRTLRALVLSATTLASCCAWAAAPGEDPIILNNTAVPQGSALPGAAPSSSDAARRLLPARMKAKMARYQARAFRDDLDDIYTDNDVVRSASADGLKKVCVQEVGSNTVPANSGLSSGRYGPQARQQVVVLRGDLVNVCK